ncbi:ABC transporter ATP-binding protein [Pseudothauera nasutitermitis]|uniref:ABC transporter ATP-binding protein n=1 Tax=Pseudothauera nasutitermitis TaxID=2565930 RepID=A0A4S4B6F1_9RHOO|nr:ABC transporter ATP-binding protein [Pseudothauera nasutitermitis]THF67406.1 ABC transporter ATP-binding protein [Pseudothauera nasutitermitis]
MFLAVEQLKVSYRGQAVPAVDDVSLGLNAGEIGVLVGPSGCGKTTLLRTVAGLEEASAGRIALQGETISSRQKHKPVAQRRIGMVFQDYALFPHLDVSGNVAFGIHDMPVAERNARVAEVLARVGLDGLQARYPHELSGGQQQRVALARALAPRPRLLLLDEPFSNLDAELRERLAHEMRTIFKAAGVTVLFVTHDQMEAFAIGDVVGVMNRGRLHQWADVHTVYHRPATRFVARFIGDGVFIPARFEPRDEGAAMRTPLGLLRAASGSPLAEFQGAGQCQVLLRAHDIVYDETSPVRARLVRKSFQGAWFLCTLQLSSGDLVLAYLPSYLEHAVGDWVGIRPQVRHLAAFAQES